MRTLQIGNDWPEERIGGLNRYFVELIRHLPDAGVQVKALVVGSEQISTNTAGTVHPFARRDDGLLRRMLSVRQAAAKEIQSGEVDVLVSHFALYAAPLGNLIGRLPFVVHFHGPWAAESGVEGSASLAFRAKLALERRVYRKANRFIVLSKSFANELVARYAVNGELIRIIPGGVDTSRFNASQTREGARLRLGWPSDRLVILAVRRLVRRMGLENLIDAMGTVARTHPDVLLLLGGTGPLESELRARVAKEGLERNVRLLGRLSEEDLPVAYRAADMTVVPSQALEGFGMITLESLASGTPVLVTPVGGLPEVIAPFSPECVFPSTASADMAASINDILQGIRKLPSSDACRTYAVEHFSWPVISERVRDVYLDAASST